MSARRILPHSWLILAPGLTRKSRTGRQGISVFCRLVFVRRLIVHHTTTDMYMTGHESTANTSLGLTSVTPENSPHTFGRVNKLQRIWVKVQGQILCCSYFNVSLFSLATFTSLPNIWTLKVWAYWGMITIYHVMEGASLKRISLSDLWSTVKLCLVPTNISIIVPDPF